MEAYYLEQNGVKIVMNLYSSELEQLPSGVEVIGKEAFDALPEPAASDQNQLMRSC